MKRILLVEDTRHLLEEIADVLRLEGYQIKTAINALQALERLPEFGPDLIITDLQMPWMNGFEFIQLVRKLPSHQSTPIVILSASDLEEDRIRGKEAGADFFLQKPCTVQQLVAAIKMFT